MAAFFDHSQEFCVHVLWGPCIYRFGIHSKRTWQFYEIRNSHGSEYIGFVIFKAIPSKMGEWYCRFGEICINWQRHFQEDHNITGMKFFSNFLYTSVFILSFSITFCPSLLIFLLFLYILLSFLFICVFFPCAFLSFLYLGISFYITFIPSFLTLSSFLLIFRGICLFSL